MMAKDFVALTVAGSDSGGGAGIQADLKAFGDFDVFGVSVITAVTAQNPAAVTAVHPVPIADVVAQLDAVAGAFSVGAMKTGMLYSSGLVEAVAARVAAWPRRVQLVVDPVMVATSGARLIDETAVSSLVKVLIPLARVVTPNLLEAEVFLGRELQTFDASLAAVRELSRRWGTAVLLKGGHRQSTRAVDLLVDSDRAWQLDSARVDARTTHGSGCALSAAIAAHLAKGTDLLPAVEAAKAYVQISLQGARQVGPGTWARWAPRGVHAVSVSEITVTEL